MRGFSSALVAAVIGWAGPALACLDSFGGLDNHNAVWERTLGITFDNPVIKSSSMNDRCWIEDRIAVQTLDKLAQEGIAPDAAFTVYEVPGVRIEPDYATYSDDREAYENGKRTSLGGVVLRIMVTSAHKANVEAIHKQLAGRGLASEAGSAGKVENSEGTKSFGGIDVALFTSRTKRGALKSDSYASAAYFTAPSNPDLLVVLLGDTNFETDRVGGIRLEETFHQVLRDMERTERP